MILPSHPSIRLWEDSQDALVSERTAMAPAVSFTSKSRFLAGPGIAFCDEARPLRRVFFLGEGDALAPTIEPLRPAEALIELVKHSFLLDIEARDMLARHFDDLYPDGGIAHLFPARLSSPLQCPGCRCAKQSSGMPLNKMKAANMNLSDKVSIPTQVMARTVGDETVILDLASGTYYGLDPVGARMWQLMTDGQTLAAICDTLLDEYEVTRETLEGDILRLTEELRAKGLVSLA